MLNCTLLCTVKQHSTEILILSPDLIPHELLCLHRPVGRRVEKRGGEGRESGGEKGKKKRKCHSKQNTKMQIEHYTHYAHCEERKITRQEEKSMTEIS
jgi:hypothetical protein